MSEEQKQRCEKCGRKIKARWMFRVYKGGMDVCVGPTCRKKYIACGMYAEEDFVPIHRGKVNVA